MFKYNKNIVTILMVLALLLLAGINMKDDLLPNAEIRGGVSSIIISVFLGLVLTNLLIYKQLVVRGWVISKEESPKLFLAGVIALSLVVLIFLAAGIINLL